MMDIKPYISDYYWKYIKWQEKAVDKNEQAIAQDCDHKSRVWTKYSAWRPFIH